MLYKFIFVILSFICIYVYVSILKESGHAENKDILNIKIFEFDVCGWNLLHILFNFSICYIFNIQTITGYAFIFLGGVVWFFFEKSLFFKYNSETKQNSEIKNDKYVYSSISHPRPDDIIYNCTGLILHYIAYNKC